ncbi:MAG: putative membrane protein [Bradymonadia bacterium]|jgi:uncharacterized membrane protein
MDAARVKRAQTGLALGLRGAMRYDCFMALAWLKIGHFAGLLAWIGGLLAVARLVGLQSTAPTQPTVTDRASQIGRGLYWRWAAPGAFVALACGVLMLAVQRDLLKQPFMHAKLGCVAAIILCDQLCLRRLKQMRARGGSPDGRGRWLTLALALASLGAVIFITLRPWERA